MCLLPRLALLSELTVRFVLLQMLRSVHDRCCLVTAKPWQQSAELRAKMTGAHGLSLLITTEVGDEKHTFLFDCGPESKSIDRNVKALEVDLTKVEAIALSVSSVSLLSLASGYTISSLGYARRRSIGILIIQEVYFKLLN